jgi:hypothetical protein
MKFFALMLEVTNLEAVYPLLLKFKENLSKEGRVTVISLEESNYDFLYNSLIEKAVSEKRRE